jgi:hypothetical protein
LSREKKKQSNAETTINALADKEERITLFRNENFPTVCMECGKHFKDYNNMAKHVESTHWPKNHSYALISSAFHKTCAVFCHNFIDGPNEDAPPRTIEEFFARDETQLKLLIDSFTLYKRRFKFALIIYVLLSKFDKSEEGEGDGEYVTEEHCLRTYQFPGGMEGVDVPKALEYLQAQLQSRIDDYISEEGSGWSLHYISRAHLEFACYAPIAGSSGSLQLKYLPGKKYLLNTACPEDLCFFYCIANFFAKDNATDMDKYNFIKNNINDDGIPIPVPLQSIERFERINSKNLNIRINIFLLQGKQLLPVRAGSSINKTTRTINILLIQKGIKQATEEDANMEEDLSWSEDDEGGRSETEDEESETEDGAEELIAQRQRKQVKNHYILIKDLDKFSTAFATWSRQQSVPGKSYAHQTQQRAVCPNCINGFWSSDARDRHLINCETNPPQRVEMPLANEFLQFSKPHTSVPFEYYGVFDFEAKMMPSNRKETAKTVFLNAQTLASYSIAIFNIKDEIVFEKTEAREIGCLESFADTIFQLEKRFSEIFQENKPIVITTEQEADFRCSSICYMCEDPFNEENFKVRDHNHLTGLYLGAAHLLCNLKRRRQIHIPIFAHNFSGYDSHFLIQALAKKALRAVKGMAYNTEKIRNLTFGVLKFQDSMHFIPSGLADIVRNLKKSNYNFPILRKSGIVTTKKHLKLLTRKGVFPYDLLQSVEQFRSITTFPPHESFHGVLHGNITKAEYKHGQKVYKEFKCRNMVDYLLLYNKLDVLLLAEALAVYRKFGMKHFKLDVMQYISLPQVRSS